MMGIRIFQDVSSLTMINNYSSSGSVVADLTKICHVLLGLSLILDEFELPYPLWGAPATYRISESFVE